MAGDAHSESESLQRIGRAGWVVRGFVYLAFGATVAALVGADVGSGESADVQGGVDLIAEIVPGPILYVVAVGVLLYALWRFAEAGMPGDWGGKAVVERIGKAGSGLIYGGLAWITFQSATGNGSASSASGSGSGSGGIARGLLGSTAGRIGLGIVGLGIVGVGLYKLERGIRRKFLESIDQAEVGISRDAVEKLGLVGHVGRAIVYGILGGFVVAAAVTYDPEKASGVDRALTEVADTWWGRPLLAFTALGLVAYGIYCVLTATGQQLERPGS